MAVGLALTMASFSAMAADKTAVDGQASVPATTAYREVERGANHKVWQRETYERGPDGKVVTRIHNYTELVSGMHFLNSQNEWQEAKEEIEATPGGAVARQGQHQVIFANNLNSYGAIDLQTPDGKRLRSNILGLSYTDRSTGQSVLIAQVQDSQGELIATNQVLYPDAFKGLKASVRYTNKRGCFEQDVILLEKPPTPESFGLSSATTELEVITEFFSNTNAVVKEHRARKSSGGDQEVAWGTMHLGRGKAFDLGEANDPRKYKSVQKHYEKVNGRNILLEMVPVNSIQTNLDQLPLQSSTTVKHPVLAAKARPLPPTPLAKADQNTSMPGKFAAIPASDKGYVLDYVLVDAEQTDFTFQTGRTYYVSGALALHGTTVFQGGAVIKGGEIDFDSSSSIICDATNSPIVLTSPNDDSVGEIIDGSSGSPSINEGVYLAGLPDATTIRNMRFYYSNIGIESWAGHCDIWDSQFFKFGYCAILKDGAGGNWLGLHNVLIAQDSINLGYYGAVKVSGDTVVVEHVTVCNVTMFIYDVSGGAQIGITNSLIIGCYGMTDGSSAIQDHVEFVPNPDSGLFQSGAAANYYLATGSPYRDLGTTAIDPVLLAELSTMTTYAPQDGSWPDTNAPDLGYHYPANEDSDYDGLPDWWEYRWFGNYTHTSSGDGDSDGDGFSNNNEYLNGTDPLDYYNGILPSVIVVSGDGQTGVTNHWLSHSLTVQVVGNNSSVLTNAPLTFTITQGNALIARSMNNLATNLPVVTGPDGRAKVWLRLPGDFGTNVVTVTAQSGTNVVQVEFVEMATTASTNGLSAMVAIGGERIMRLTSSGEVVSWGGNQFGELGDYTHLDSTNPVHIVGLTNIVKIASGLNHSLAIDANGALWAWGDNQYAQLGSGDLNSTNRPVQVAGMTDSVIAMAGGSEEYGYAISSAIKSDGSVWTWGKTHYNPCSGAELTTVPAQIGSFTNAVAVSVGGKHSLVLLNDGLVWSWGEELGGQLGDGNQWGVSQVPVPVLGLSNIVAICAGAYHSLALDIDGGVWAWGMNDSGQLGDGGSEAAMVLPVMVFSNAVQIAAGVSHSLVLDDQGNVWAWGRNNVGQLGDGSINDTNLPMQLLTVSNVVAIVAGSDASAAIDAAGNIWQWGSSDSDATSWGWNDSNGLPTIVPQFSDFYAGQLPQLTVLNGDQQLGHAGMEFMQSLVFQVRDPNGLVVSNAPVSVEVVQGDMELRAGSGGNSYKGLRLNSDAAGEVSLVGYADQNSITPDCRVRVLAASRERIVEAGLNEMIVPPPTVTIISPQAGSTCFVGTNQSLSILVEPFVASGFSIREVDYSYQADDGSIVSLGASTNSPYSFVWTNTIWTNAFVGNYTLMAVAVDNAGAQSDPQSVNITVLLDSNGTGLPDFWQLQYFNQLGVDPNSDADGDGQSNLQEYQNGSSPTEFYNNALPILELISGNDQCGKYNSFLPQPVTLEVKHDQATPWLNAPVVFTVTNGTALLAAGTNDTPVSTLTLRSDTNGMISAWIYFPPGNSNPPDSTIMASVVAGDQTTAATINEFIPLAHWTFNDTNTWEGEGGQMPLLATNLAGLPSWSVNAVLVDSLNQAGLAYNLVETNGSTNINCQTGSLLFWFRPNWSSADQGGDGPESFGRLIEAGDYNPVFADNWWSLYFSPDGSQLLFATSTSGVGMTNLTASISWSEGEWYEIALTYSPTGSALYVNGQLLASGAGVNCSPNADVLNQNFRIGSDQDGGSQAHGTFDELRAFEYPLAADNTFTHGSEIPNWWEIKYFNQVGMNPEFQPVGDGMTLLLDYKNNKDPNVIDFTLSAKNRYVNSAAVPIQINNLKGIPALMSVVVRTTNYVVDPDKFFNVTNMLADAVWRPYETNIVVSMDLVDVNYYVWVGLQGRENGATKTWHQLTLTADTSPPVLVITNPVLSTVSTPIIQVQGLANESLSLLTYDISNAAGLVTNLTGYTTELIFDTNRLAFTVIGFQCYDVALTNGLNTITLHATDLVGNVTTTNFCVTLDYSNDFTPPVFEVVWPTDGTYISGTEFDLQGQLDDATATVTATIVDATGTTNVVAGVVDRIGRVRVKHLPLATGANTLMLTTTDAAGNSSTSSETLYQGAVRVTLDPLADTQLNQSLVMASGTVSSPGATVIVNGILATVESTDNGTGSYNWSAVNVPVSPYGLAAFDLEVANDNGSSTMALAKAEAVSETMTSDSNSSHQLFEQSQGVKVRRKNYWAVTSFHGEDDSYGANNGSDGPAYWNYHQTVFWTEQFGGSNQGFYYYSGAFNYSQIYQPEAYDNWYYAIPAGKENPTSGPVIGQTVSSEIYSTQSHYVISPEDAVVFGSSVLYCVKAKLNDYSDGKPLDPAGVMIHGQYLRPILNNGSIWGITYFTAPAGVEVDITPTTDGNFSYQLQVDELPIPLLAVDANRDGNITFDAVDQTSAAKPFRFWVNDSIESGDIVSGSESQIPGNTSTYYDENGQVVHSANSYQNTINGRSDLVNYFPVTLSLSNVLESLPPTNGFEYHLVQSASAVKFVYTSLTPTNAFDYLTNTASSGYGADADKDAYRADTILVSGIPGVTLDTNWLVQVQNNGGTGVILIEGCAATKQALWLEIWRDGKLLGGTPLYLSIDGVEKMFRHKNLRDGNDAPSGLSGDLQRRDADLSPPTQTGNPANNPDALSGDPWFVFIVGSNVGGAAARGWESEVFKRMYWSGSRARFVGVSWYGDPYIDGYDQLYYYQMAVRNAFATAPALTTFVNGLSGGKTVAGHSLACGLIASAIADQGMKVNNACLMDAAFAQECFDGETDDNLSGMRPAAWANYPPELWAAHWYERFDASDARSTLTWRNRFAGAITKANVYSFYSSTEEVLGEFDGTVTKALVENVLNPERLGAYAWVIQEKSKGDKLNILGVAHAGSDYGGWGFNLNDPLLNGDPVWYAPYTSGGSVIGRRVKTADEMGMVGEDGAVNAELALQSRWTPLFKTGWGRWDGNNPTSNVVDTSPSYNSGPSWIFDLYARDSTGSAVATDPVKRNQLLAEAIPALSLPVGANYTTKLQENQFDMPALFANKTHWPRDPILGTDTRAWHHSDMDQVAYPYLFEFYNKLVSISNH